jgi:hypothetical protein
MRDEAVAESEDLEISFVPTASPRRFLLRADNEADEAVIVGAIMH